MMCTFEEALEKAKEMFPKKGYLNKVFSASDLPDKWLFFGRFSEDSEVEYGNRPISVDKETGEAEWFYIYTEEHIREYIAAVPIVLDSVKGNDDDKTYSGHEVV